MKNQKCFLLDNVQGLTSAPFRPSFEEMLSTLRSEGQYLVSWRVRNTADYGIPQIRPRLYIIGMRCSALPGGKMGFKWPQKRECVQLSSLLDPSCVMREQPGRGTVGDKNLKQLKKALAQGGVTKASGPIALDIFPTKGRAVVGKVPCLTRTRAGSGGYYSTTTGGLLTTHEMLRLQGLPENFGHTASQVGISQRQLRQMIGNAMSVNVLALVLSRRFVAMGLAAKVSATSQNIK